MPRTHGRFHPAWCSTTACVTSSTLLHPVRARQENLRPHFFRRPRRRGSNRQFVINPQPRYRFNLDGLGPRVQLDWLAGAQIHVRAAGGITTIPPNLYQDNFLTGSNPFAVDPRLTSSAAAPIPYGFQITSNELPLSYTPAGQNIFANGTKAVHADTVMDINRYQRDLAALSPAHLITPLTINCVDPEFGNAYLQTWTLGLERHFGNLVTNATYIGTASAKLPRVSFLDGYAGAGPSFAPYTQFDQAGNIVGGFGTENVVTASAHSSYNALQTSLQGTVSHGGPGIQASYTWSNRSTKPLLSLGVHHWRFRRVLPDPLLRSL